MSRVLWKGLSGSLLVLLSLMYIKIYCVEAATKTGLRGGEKKRWCEVGEERAGYRRAGRSRRERDVMKRYLSK